MTLDTGRWRWLGGHTELAEAACGGVTGISWKGNRTLVVEYDGTKHADNLQDTMFVSQERRWRDVHVLYRDVHK